LYYSLKFVSFKGGNNWLRLVRFAVPIYLLASGTPGN